MAGWYPLGVTPEIKTAELPKWAPKKLLAAAGIEEGTPGADIFLQDIALALGAAEAREHRKNETMPAEVRRKLQEAHALAEQLAAELDLLRRNAVACRMIEGRTSMVDTWHSQTLAIEAELSSAQTRAEGELPAKGRLTDYTRLHLAADVAEALHRAGVSLAATRPKLNQHGKVAEPRFVSVLRVAVKLHEGVDVIDPYATARDGLKLFRQGCNN